MSVLIGGSGSTGSSLLRQILNRHSVLFCGPETSLFCKPDLYSNWKKKRSYFLLRGTSGLRSNSWHIYRGTDLLMEEMGLSQSILDHAIKTSDTFPVFCDKIYGVPLQKNNKQIWLEKTPGNVYNFKRFQERFDKGKVIHIFRNPYDTIASLVSRGFSHYYATGVYLLNTCFGLSQRKNLLYHELSYEKLVKVPTVTLMDICRFLEIEFEEEMIMGSSIKFKDDQTKIGQWSYDETGRIGEGSIGKFNELSLDDQELILIATMSISIKPSFAKKKGIKSTSITDLCPVLGYEQKLINHKPRLIKQLQSQKTKDLLLRTRKWAHYNPLNYPLMLRPYK